MVESSVVAPNGAKMPEGPTLLSGEGFVGPLALLYFFVDLHSQSYRAKVQPLLMKAFV